MVHVFIINTEETVNRNKIITIDYDFVCFSISSLWQYHYIHHFLVRIYLKTLQLHKDCIFPNQRVNHICYFDLNVVKRQKDRQVLTPYFQIIPFFVNLLDFRTIFGVFHDTVTKHWYCCVKSKNWWLWEPSLLFDILRISVALFWKFFIWPWKVFHLIFTLSQISFILKFHVNSFAGIKMNGKQTTLKISLTAAEKKCLQRKRQQEKGPE